MITLKVLDKEYFLPSNWGEVKLHQFKELSEIGKEDLTVSRGNMEKIKILVTPKIEDDLIGKFEMESFLKLSEKLEYLSVAPSITKRTPIRIGDKKYGILQDLSGVSVGEWADIEFLIKRSGDNIINEVGGRK